MNERIQELWDEVERQKEGIPSIVITSKKELQKFAEMILKECVTVIRDGNYTNTADPVFAASCDIMERFNISQWS